MPTSIMVNKNIENQREQANTSDFYVVSTFLVDLPDTYEKFEERESTIRRPQNFLAEIECNVILQYACGCLPFPFLTDMTYTTTPEPSVYTQVPFSSDSPLVPLLKTHLLDPRSYEFGPWCGSRSFLLSHRYFFRAS